MQEVQPSNHESSRQTGADTAHRILAYPDGVVQIYGSHGGLVARGFEHKLTLVAGEYGPSNHSIAWDCWYFGALHWEYKAAVLLLQGASMQQLLRPYLLLRADPIPPYSPWPGAYNVVLADVRDAPGGLSYIEMFQLLAPDVLGSLPPFGA